MVPTCRNTNHTQLLWFKSREKRALILTKYFLTEFSSRNFITVKMKLKSTRTWPLWSIISRWSQPQDVWCFSLLWDQRSGQVSRSCNMQCLYIQLHFCRKKSKHIFVSSVVAKINLIQFWSQLTYLAHIKGTGSS